MKGAAWPTVLQITTPVDTSSCVGTPAGIVRSYTAQFTGGTISENTDSNDTVVINNSVAQSPSATAAQHPALQRRKTSPR